MTHKDLTNPHYVQWLDFLKESEGWTREQIETYQFKKLKEKLQYVWDNTKGYRELWEKHGVSPQSFKYPDDISKFPCITKEDMRDGLDAFTVKIPGAKYVTTAGSTGVPFGFYWTEEAFGRELASKAYQYYRIGWKEGDPQIVFRGIPIASPDKTEFFPEFNELRFSSFHMTGEWLEVFVKKALEYKPLWLRCYPSAGFLLARFLKETGHDFPQLKGVLCASENLYYFQKELMRHVFNCRIFSHYGHCELSALAGFCEHTDNYHVLPQYGYVQLLDKDGRQVTSSGESGEIVATSFIMNGTCFIRYRTRDFAVYAGGGCEKCGRPYQLWSSVEGRAQDFFVTKSHRYISIAAITIHDDIYDELKLFQFYQDTPGVVVFKYVPKETFNEAARDKIKKKLNVKFEGDADIIFKEVKPSELAKSRRGKFIFLRQMLPIDFNIPNQS
jgi:phenylacetate-CoA ligase